MWPKRGTGGGLRIIDVSTPSLPQEMGFITGIVAYGVAVSGSYAYVAGGGGPGRRGLHIIDVSTPSTPQEVGFFETGDAASDVAVSGSYAYVANWLDGLRIIDVSNPSLPQEVGFFETGWQARGVAVSGSYAYVANGYTGLRIIDVSNPSLPQEVGFFDTGGYAYRVVFNGGFAYVADGLDGMYIIQNDILVGINEESSFSPASFVLAQNYPNPFNPTTTINYQIPELSNVTLTVYDVLGNEIAKLVNEEKPVGSYEVKFDGSELTSGIYFYKIQAGDFAETKKMVLMK